MAGGTHQSKGLRKAPPDTAFGEMGPEIHAHLSVPSPQMPQPRSSAGSPGPGTDAIWERWGMSEGTVRKGVILRRAPADPTLPFRTGTSRGEARGS